MAKIQRLVELGGAVPTYRLVGAREDGYLWLVEPRYEQVHWFRDVEDTLKRRRYDSHGASDEKTLDVLDVQGVLEVLMKRSVVRKRMNKREMRTVICLSLCTRHEPQKTKGWLRKEALYFSCTCRTE